MRPAVFLAGLALTLASGCAVGPDPSTPSSPDARIVLGDADLLAGEATTVVLTDLDPGSPVTVTGEQTDDLGRRWASSATFDVGPGGVVDLARAVPAPGGTYGIADPMGPVRSLRPVDGSPPGGPPVPVSEVATTTLTATQDRTPIATTDLVQRATAPGVTRRDVRVDGIVGELYLPPGPGPHPAVVLLSGSEGGIAEYGMGRLLASHGFAAFGLAYFGEAGLPPTLERIPLEYLEGGMTWLRAQPEVSDGPVGLLGGSRGGELALLVGSASPQVGAVVSYVGSGLVQAGLGGSWPPASAWTREGREVPWMPYEPTSGQALDRYLLPWLLGAPMRDIAGSRDDVARLDPADRERATIPVERIRGPVLLLSGTADRLWPSTALSEVALERLRSGGHRFGHAHHAYPGAGHFILGAPHTAGLPPALVSEYGRITGGGDPDANARATADSWPRVLETLRTGLVEGGRS